MGRLITHLGVDGVKAGVVGGGKKLWERLGFGNPGREKQLEERAAAAIAAEKGVRDSSKGEITYIPKPDERWGRFGRASGFTARTKLRTRHLGKCLTACRRPAAKKLNRPLRKRRGIADAVFSGGGGGHQHSGGGRQLARKTPRPRGGLSVAHGDFERRIIKPMREKAQEIYNELDEEVLATNRGERSASPAIDIQKFDKGLDDLLLTLGENQAAPVAAMAARLRKHALADPENVAKNARVFAKAQRGRRQGCKKWRGARTAAKQNPNRPRWRNGRMTYAAAAKEVFGEGSPELKTWLAANKKPADYSAAQLTRNRPRNI